MARLFRLLNIFLVTAAKSRGGILFIDVINVFPVFFRSRFWRF